MKIIQKEKFSRTTGLVERVRQASKSRKSVALTTAADVFGYQNLHYHLRQLGYNTHLRRWGSRVFAAFGKRTRRTVPRPNPRLRSAVLALKNQDDCVAMTTPLEVAQFACIRTDLAAKGFYFKLMRNCENVWVWRDKSRKA